MAQNRPGVRVEPAGDICVVTIDRPQDRNSIDSALMKTLTHTLDHIETGSTRAVIFTGSGATYFIGGADGVEMMQQDSGGAKNFSARIQALFNRMEQSPLILAAAINGLCFGGGFEFAMACDIRVASETARIGLPEVKVGIIPGGGGTQRLPRLVGSGTAMEMILSGRLYNGCDACKMGLVQRVAAPERLMAETQALLTPILRNPQHALSQAKRAVHAAAAGQMEKGLQVEREAFGRCFEDSYFVDLMHRQLASGELQTTVKLPELKRNERNDT